MNCKQFPHVKKPLPLLIRYPDSKSGPLGGGRVGAREWDTIANEAKYDNGINTQRRWIITENKYLVITT